MFWSLSYNHHQGSITVLVQLLLIGVHTSSFSGLWLCVVGVSVRPMYLSLWCLVMYITRHHKERYIGHTELKIKTHHVSITVLWPSSGVNHRPCAVATYQRAYLVLFRSVAVCCRCFCASDVTSDAQKHQQHTATDRNRTRYARR
jgi:hypothetical protein